MVLYTIFLSKLFLAVRVKINHWNFDSRLEIPSIIAQSSCSVVHSVPVSDDEAYVEDGNSRKEYILEDEGVIFVGTTDWNHARAWSFGQVKNKIDLPFLHGWKRTTNTFSIISLK